MSEAPESTTTLGDGPCMRCGYNLRGLTPDARCPECGLPAQDSLAYSNLNLVNARWFTAVRRGIVIYAVGFLLALVWLFASDALIDLVFRRLDFAWDFIEPTEMAVQLCILGLSWWGAQLIADKRVLRDDSAADGRHERMTRLAANVILAKGLLGLILSRYLLTTLDLSGFYRIGLGSLGAFVNAILNIWFWWAMLGLVRSIFKTMDKGLWARQARILQWSFVVVYLVSALLFNGTFVAQRIESLWIFIGYFSYDADYFVTLVGSSVLMLAFVWLSIVMWRLYIWLGRYRAGAAATPPGCRSPWIPEEAVKFKAVMLRGVKKSWELARYRGPQGD